MSTHSTALPNLTPYQHSNESTLQSPSVMLANDENFIHKRRKNSGIPDVPNTDTTKQVQCLQRLILSLPIFHPFGTFKKCWNFIITIMLIYSAIEIPITFVASLRIWSYVNFYSVIALVIDAFLFIDILISFRTARFFKYDHLKLEDNAFKLAKRYLFGTFLVDLATAFPYQLVMNSNQFNVLFTILRSLKLIRLYNMMKQSTSNRSITSTQKEFRSFVRIFKLGCAVLLIIHYTACIWWWEGEATKPSWMDAEKARDFDTFEKYSYSLYFVVTIKFIKATNVMEQWITIIHTLIGTATLSYFIGTLSSMISKGDRIKTQKEIQMSEAQAFCDQHQLPSIMTRAILAHLKYHCANNYIFDKNKIFNNIPTYLHKMVAKQLAQRVVEKITFFKPLRSYVRGLIAINTRSISCNAGHKLFKKGDKYNNIYIQRTGQSVLTFHDGSGQKMTKRRGDVFGEDALRAYVAEDSDGHNRSISTLLCKTWSEFYVINVDDIIDILKSEYGNKWRKKLKAITEIIAVKNNISNNRYTPRYQITDIDLATTNKAEKSLKSLFQFNEFESIIHPQLGDMQTSGNNSDNLSPFDPDTNLKQMDTIQIEKQKSKSILVQLADIKRNSYRTVSMSDDIDGKEDSDSNGHDDDTDDHIDIVFEETKENVTEVRIKNDNDESDGKANNLYAVSKHFSKKDNGTKNRFKRQKYASHDQLNTQQAENGAQEQKNDEFIDRAETMSVINMKPIGKNNPYFKPRSMSFSISDDSIEREVKPQRNRTRSFNLRRSYFKKTKSEIRDRNLSREFDGSTVKLTIPNLPENSTIYNIDEGMD